MDALYEMDDYPYIVAYTKDVRETSKVYPSLDEAADTYHYLKTDTRFTWPLQTTRWSPSILSIMKP